MTPHGSLRLDRADDDFVLESGLADRLEKSFERGAGHGLLHLGAGEAGSVLPPSLAWWRDFGMRFIADLCALGDAKGSAGGAEVAAPTSGELEALIDDAPPMRGGEYLRPDVLAQHWAEIGGALEVELSESGLSLSEFLKTRDSRWRLVGRVHFNLAENRRDLECPFAFMATYTSSLAASGALRHLPLGQALREFAGAGDRAKLLHLLDPVSRASETCSWLKAIVDAGEIFHPLRWTPQEAMLFLHDVEAMEQSGLVIRMPANWRMNRPSRPRVEATVGSTSPSVLGLDALLDFQVGVSLDGEALTAAEIKELLASTDGLALVRGKWVEVDRERLQATLHRFQEIERLSRREGVPFGKAMRLLAGAEIDGGAGAEPIAQWKIQLLNGWDDIDLTLAEKVHIDRFRAEDCAARPWASCR
jgi:non-specific serine/threonine protein kinase